MTHAPVFVSPADELRELAAECLEMERHYKSAWTATTPRMATRGMLADHARDIGIPAGEIDAAVDAAIAGAGT